MIAVRILRLALRMHVLINVCSVVPMLTSYKVPVFLPLSSTPSLIMSLPIEYKSLLETRKNGSPFCPYKLNALPDGIDESATTYLISTIDHFHRAE